MWWNEVNGECRKLCTTYIFICYTSLKQYYCFCELRIVNADMANNTNNNNKNTDRCSRFGIWFSFIFCHLLLRPIQFISLRKKCFPALTGSALSTTLWQDNAQNASHILKRNEYTRKWQWISVVSCYCQMIWCRNTILMRCELFVLLLLLFAVCFCCCITVALIWCHVCVSWSFVVLWGFDIVIWISVSYLSCSSMLSAWIIYLSFMPLRVEGREKKKKS